MEDEKKTIYLWTNNLHSILRLIHSQTICVRQAQGYCCVQYQLCADQTNPFTLDRTLIAADVIKGLVDSSCTLDYVAIPGKSLLILCRCSYLPKHWYLMRSFMLLFLFYCRVCIPPHKKQLRVVKISLKKIQKLPGLSKAHQTNLMNRLKEFL